MGKFTLLRTIYFLKIFCCLYATNEHGKKISFPEMVGFINSYNTTWQAHHNFDPDIYQEGDFSILCGSRKGKNILPLLYKTKKLEYIPKTFDARKLWSYCPSIGRINDQGACGSCWAVSAAEAMTDRYCIASKGLFKIDMSAQDLLTCCQDCGKGCKGGFPQRAWQYWTEEGLVNGGWQYDKSRGCQPYTLQPCEHGVLGKRLECLRYNATPACEHSCKGNSKMNYKYSKLYGTKAYRIPTHVKSIQSEILENGPVQAEMMVYSDFTQYRKGVYRHITGNYTGNHAVKIIGWGTERRTPYWLIANSWNTDWGDKGFFKILRGRNEVNIESGIIAGIPQLPANIWIKN